nr:transketolase family protein [Patescibacteria group bacterium]
MSATKTSQASTRDGFGDGLAEIGKQKEQVVTLTADLTDSTKCSKFAKEFPNRFIQVGIGEQNMASIAAGLALSGKIPYMASYAVFSPGGNWASIRTSICYTNANVKIVATHSGFSPAADGATHQALEDIAITRVLPNITVLVPCDYWQSLQATKAAAQVVGPVYIRLTRNDTPNITNAKTEFKIGKAQVLKTGTDVTVIACGPIINEVLAAANELDYKKGPSLEIINVHTIKPLDVETIVKSAKKTGLVMTVEEHQVAGGLGSAIAEALSEIHPTKVHRMGAQDTFGESGTYEELLEKYGLSKKHIINKVLSILDK